MIQKRKVSSRALRATNKLSAKRKGKLNQLDRRKLFKKRFRWSVTKALNLMQIQNKDSRALIHLAAQDLAHDLLKGNLSSPKAEYVRTLFSTQAEANQFFRYLSRFAGVIPHLFNYPMPRKVTSRHP
ncbi:MAG: hypothetical protein Q7S92_02040 [Candidatus Diapherotrites archaeon]|nr:hypothetical protein [Candidatus Diapherotrites archaeon]